MKKANAAARAKQLRSEKRAKTGTVIIMCLVAMCLAGVIGVGAFTDVFKQESEVKAVALVLSQAEEEELESQLARLTPLVQQNITGEFKTVDLLSFIKPYSKDGLYSAFGYGTALPSVQADPAMRFKDSEGNYKYYKITRSKVDSILSQFDVNADHTINTKDIYYYDGNYYFAAAEDEGEEPDFSADITASKRIQDGRYYLTCKIDGKDIYVIAGKEDLQSKQWKIREISSEPIFDQLGIMIKTEQESIFDYEIKTKVIEGKGEDETLFCRYTVEYPVFYGDTAGETEANRFYQSIITYYTQLAQDSASEYKKYVKKGGVQSVLPLETYFSAEVTYTSGAYIAVSNEISETQPVYESQNNEEDVPASAVVPSKKTVECYIFDTETGDYVTKDSIIGKDYQLIEELLYRLYCGYDYEALLNEEVSDTITVPSDGNKLGKKIYESANTLSEDGYVFCYVNEMGYRENVIIPYNINIFEVPIG